jgi:hypothetical protein
MKRETLEKGKRSERRDLQVMGSADFTDADIAALEVMRAPAEAASFNDEVME